MPTLPGDDDTARADVAHLITELLVSGSLTTDDAEGRHGPDRVRGAAAGADVDRGR